MGRILPRPARSASRVLCRPWSRARQGLLEVVVLDVHALLLKKPSIDARKYQGSVLHKHASEHRAEDCRRGADAPLPGDVRSHPSGEPLRPYSVAAITGSVRRRICRFVRADGESLAIEKGWQECPLGLWGGQYRLPSRDNVRSPRHEGGLQQMIAQARLAVRVCRAGRAACESRCGDAHLSPDDGETRYLVRKETIGKMKAGVVIVQCL